MSNYHISRRGLLGGLLGATVASGIAGCGFRQNQEVIGMDSIDAREAALGASGDVRSFKLTADFAEIDLGGRIARTWAYGNILPGKIIRVNKGDRVKVNFKNKLPVPTSVHWHGLAIRNDMDGVPGVTTPEVQTEKNFNFDFITPDAGTYWFHPHSGTQLDRGLYAPFIVDDPNEPLNYDREWILILDDWTDGVGKNPDQIFAELKNSSAGGMDMGGMDMGGMDAGDVAYPMHLINGRPNNDPETLFAKPGERIRLRIINAAADTIFHVALSQHSMSVTYTDGFPVKPSEVTLLQIGMGERYDAVVTLKDGIFPLVAQAVGKSQHVRALIRTASGRVPSADFLPSELNAIPLRVETLKATDAVRLPSKKPDRIQDLILTGSMNPYIWKINGRTYDQTKALTIRENEMGRLRIRNMSMMPHPIHLHGHTFQLGNAGGSGARKDTVLLQAMGSIDVDYPATNPGKWMIHCHNAYHAEAGMMTRLEYIV
ncbi:MAG: multicopper oxidase family protein [Candidatus Nanopelagicaceae bacterium]|nr:multicopper oxidase family protein [Candidatus Nanopelagicaceae bacterium]